MHELGTEHVTLMKRAEWLEFLATLCDDLEFLIQEMPQTEGLARPLIGVLNSKLEQENER